MLLGGFFPARAGHKTEFYSLHWVLLLKGGKSGGVASRVKCL